MTAFFVEPLAQRRCANSHEKLTSFVVDFSVVRTRELRSVFFITLLKSLTTMIISASRRTDIPACFAAWFMRCLRAGEVVVRNPYNASRASHVDLLPSMVDCIVFFSKNYLPLLEHLPKVRALGHKAAFQYTLNAYGTALEPHLPPLPLRVDVFLRLAAWAKTRHAMTWRYDPVILDARHNIAWHVENFGKLCSRLQGHVHRCIFSFVDSYAHLPRETAAAYSAQSPEQQWELAGMLAKVATEHNISLATCAEAVDLEHMGITHAACLDAKQLALVVGHPLRIPQGTGQRTLCRCVRCVDVGAYNTCTQGCVYCYATSNAGAVQHHARTHSQHDPALGGPLPQDICLTERTEPSCKIQARVQQGSLLPWINLEKNGA